MDKLLEQGIISSLLEGFSPEARPLLEAGVVILVAGGGFAAALNPILDLISKILGFFGWVGSNVYSFAKKIFGKNVSQPVEPGTRELPDERTIWESKQSTAAVFPQTHSIPIITIANMKGGVGKTTIAANLAVYFREKLGKPILLIDLDYQGSLSQSIRGEAKYPTTDPDITADVLIAAPGKFPDPLVYAREMREKVKDIFIYPATYQFATIENNEMADWLASGQSDLMYRLCAILRRDEFQSKFGAIIIDCPPRLTTGTINALCASTHLLVPCTLDDMAAQATEYFLNQIARMSSKLFPRLKVLGVLPSIVYQDGYTLTGEIRTRDRLVQFGKKVWNDEQFILWPVAIPRTADISNYSGTGVAYTRKPSTRQTFNKLGDEIRKRL